MLRKLLSLLFFLILFFFGIGRCLATAKPNIVLITLSSVRADRMGFLGSRAGVTPNLDAISRHSLVFVRAVSQSPLTLASHATILTGTYPQTHLVTELGTPLPDSLQYLPSILHSEGFATAAFVGSIELDPRNGLAPGFDRGFTIYDAGFHEPEAGKSRYTSVARRGNMVVARAISWLNANANAPFFLWVHLDDADVDSEAPYDRAIAADDAAVGRLVAALRTRKLYDASLVAITSDHGEGMGAHGEQTHGIFLYDETLHVPLILKLPGSEMSGKRIQALASLVDLTPTILEVARIPVPPQMQGQSLLRIASGRREQAAYSRSDFPQRAFGWSAVESWRVGKYLYIRAPKPELYDLSQDASATRNLVRTSGAVLQTMAAQMTAFDQRLAGQSNTSSSGLTSSETQKLASLGYVGLQKPVSGAAIAVSGIDPKNEVSAENKVLRALFLIDDGKPEKALVALQSLGTEASGEFLAQFAMGSAQREQGHCALALAYFHKAIELRPASSWAHYQMGSCLAKTGDYNSAVVHLEIAAKRLPEFSDAHSLLAQAYEHTGRSDAAKRERERAVSSR